MLIEAQNCLIRMVANLIFSKQLNHVRQNIVDGTFFPFEIPHCLDYHVF